MADDRDRQASGILGDINPVPSTREHKAGSAGQNEEKDNDKVTGGTTGNAGTDVGGTRNYRTGTGQTGGDLGNRPE